MKSHSLGYVGIVFVALAGAEALNVIWRIGGPMEGLLRDFGSALPAPTQLALESRAGLRVVVLSVLALAVGVHRHQRAVLFLVLLGLLQLAIAGAFFLAMWLPFSGYFGTSTGMVSGP